MATETKHMIEIKSDLYDDLKEYCELNKLKINVFINNLIKSAFMVEKYGYSPLENMKNEILKGTEKGEEEIKEIVSNLNEDNLNKIQDDIDKLILEPSKNEIEVQETNETKENIPTITIEKNVQEAKEIVKPVRRRLK